MSDPDTAAAAEADPEIDKVIVVGQRLVALME